MSYATDHRGTPTERFWAKVDTSAGLFECWPWTGRWRGRNGYGRLFVDGATVLATHISLMLAGVEIPDGQLVRHSCDNPPCVNPAHLLVGTYADNTRDAIERGRLRTGERRSNHKLSDQVVRDIRMRYAAGSISQYRLAKEYGVTQRVISRVVQGQAWRHV